MCIYIYIYAYQYICNNINNNATDNSKNVSIMIIVTDLRQPFPLVDPHRQAGAARAVLVQQVQVVLGHA